MIENEASISIDISTRHEEEQRHGSSSTTPTSTPTPTPTNTPPLFVCDNLHQAAKSILSHSFAIYRVDRDTHESFVNAWKSSRDFFAHIHENTNGGANHVPPASTASTTASTSATTSVSTCKEKDCLYMNKYRNIHEGNLYGLNRPSEAKLLFRAFFSSKRIATATTTTKEETNTGTKQEKGTRMLLDQNEYNGASSTKNSNSDSNDNDNGSILHTPPIQTHTSLLSDDDEHQPWPDDFDGGALKHCSRDLSTRVHDILLNCVKEIQSIVHGYGHSHDDHDHDSDDDAHVDGHVQQECSTVNNNTNTSPLRLHKKRKMYQTKNDKLHCYDSSGLGDNGDDSDNVDNHLYNSKNDTDSNTIVQAKSTSKPTSTTLCCYHCPLDFFLYHNLNNNAINCSEHIDRGVLICISLTNVEGLELLFRSSLLSPSSSSYQSYQESLTSECVVVCPEQISALESLYKENACGCSDLICILSGDQLSKIVAEQDNHGDSDVIDGDTKIKSRYPGLAPCVHRVKNHLCRARLSISYELRIL